MFQAAVVMIVEVCAVLDVSGALVVGVSAEVVVIEEVFVVKDIYAALVVGVSGPDVVIVGSLC